jgi:hypothetical protein
VESVCAAGALRLCACSHCDGFEGLALALLGLPPLLWIADAGVFGRPCFIKVSRLFVLPVRLGDQGVHSAATIAVQLGRDVLGDIRAPLALARQHFLPDPFEDETSGPPSASTSLPLPAKSLEQSSQGCGEFRAPPTD